MQICKLAFAFIAFVIVGCGGSKHQQSESVLLRSYRLIDSGQPDDAIALLHDEIDARDAKAANGQDQSGETNELRVTLASAYAQKAGITIREIAESYQLGKKIAQVKFKDIDASYRSEGDRKVTTMLNMVLIHFRTIETVTIVPKVPSDRLRYLEQAVKVLDSTAQLGQADLLYAAILKLVTVRSMLESDNLKAVIPKSSDINKQCVANFSGFRDYLLRATKILISGLDNVMQAMPDKREELTRNSNDVSEVAAGLSSINAAAITIFSVDRSTLNEIYRIFGISSQEINCESISD